MEKCLTREEIERLQGGDATEDEEARLRSHLSSCASCSEQASRAVNRLDDLIEHIKGLNLSGADLDALHAGRRGEGGASGRSAAAVSPELPEANVFPGYEIVREIHHGGQGVVYQAIQQSTKRKVAIKVLLEGRFASRSSKRRFEREIDLIASLKHPNIVSIFDSGLTSDGRQFYVMDYVPGVRLEQFVKDRKLSLREALELFLRVTDAVNYAHQHGVIHRDLKPWNIVVDPEGNPKILDFGLAKTVVDKVDPLLSVSGQVVGTLPYMSPEQARGKSEEVDIRTDVYALGIILYEILTGNYPYPVKGEVMEVLHNITHVEPQPPAKAWDPTAGVSLSPSSVGKSQSKACPLDGEIETILLKALAKERERRYQSAGELARDIRHYQSGEPLDAKRDSSWYVLRKTMRRHKVPVAVGSSVVIIVTVSAIALTFMYGHARRNWELAQNEARIAAQERDRALRAEELAQTRFADLRSLANAFMFEFHDKIKDLAGSVPARELLVTKALEYLDGLQKSAATDFGLLRELAVAYKRVGDVQGGMGMGNIGDTPGALKSYQQGRELLEKLLESDKSNEDEDRRNLAVFYNCEGDMHSLLGDKDKEHELRMKARDAFQTLMERHPKDATALHDLATVYSRMGEHHLRQRQYVEALWALERARDLCERAHQAEPERVAFEYDLTVAIQKIGDVQIGLNKLDDALASYQKVLDINEALLKKDPTNARAKRGCSVSHDGLAKIKFVQGDTKAAIEHFEKSLHITEELAAADPDDAQAQRDLYISYASLGVYSSQMDENEKSLDYFEKAVHIAERLNKADPSSTMTLLDLASVLGNQGEALRITGHLDESLAALKRAGAAMSELLKGSPEDPKLTRNYAINLQSLGYVYSDLAKRAGTSESDQRAHLTEARNSFAAALKAFQKCRDAGFLSEQELYVFEECETEIAACDKLLASLDANDDTPRSIE